jgi:hypothetical protein
MATIEATPVSELRRGSHLTIPELLSTVSPIVRPAVQPHLPDGVLVTGCQPAGRRSPHALFTLLLADSQGEEAVRRWLACDGELITVA